MSHIYKKNRIRGIAVYPSTPRFRFKDNNINLVENLESFTRNLAESFKNVLKENKRALLIRVAHVGSLGYMEGVFEPNHRTIFIPIIGEEYEAGFISESGNIHQLFIDPLCRAKAKEGKRFRGIPALFHADPLIYYAEMESEYKYYEKTYEETESIRDMQLSATYGENDVEAYVSWLEALVENKADTTNVDAYVIFNSTFYIDDLNIDLQIIHGGFKASHWSPLGCYIDSSRPDLCCFDPPSDIHVVKNRVSLNPHYIRYREYVKNGEEWERACFNEEATLMIIGDIGDKSDKGNWFFSLPIAPPPLYFIAQGRAKTEKSREIVRRRLGGGEEEVRQRVREVLEKRGLNDVPEGIQQSLGEFLVRNYYRGEASGFIGSFRETVEKILRQGIKRKECAEALLGYYHATPQCIGKGNYSYLDLIISKRAYEDCTKEASNSNEAYRCSIAWVLGLSLLVLLDSYVRFVEQAGG